MRLRLEHQEVLLRLLSQENYPFSKVKEYLATLDKERVLHERPMEDKIIHQVLSLELRARTQKLLSPHLYSYQKGRGANEAWDKIIAWVKEYRRLPIPKTNRGIFVIQADVKSYTDTVPIGDSSELLRDLRSQYAMVAETIYAQNLIDAMRPVVEASESVTFQPNGEYQYAVGLPTGSHLTPVLANLYLGRLDRLAKQFPEGFYVRYGDDIFFAIADGLHCEQWWSKAQGILKELRLSVHPDKLQKTYWNGASRHAPEGTPHFEDYRGSVSLNHLGARIWWQGTVSLTLEKQAAWLRAYRMRIRHLILEIRRCMPKLSIIDQAKILCEATNEFFHASHPYVQMNQSSAAWRDIHLYILRILSYRLSGIKNQKAFRVVTPRMLVNECGLILPRGHKNEPD
ncbi:MAG: hypothetical protein JST80_11330 [Bdellovibrionales bacterium]|nr:hypothetical protein [Bdellovibrionales bacterium]